MNASRYQVQLRAPQTGIILAVLTYLFHDKRLDGIFCKLPAVPFIVRLSAVTKQPAESAQAIPRAFHA